MPIKAFTPYECQTELVHWDDLQLLRLIDELETSEQASDLSNGYNLMQRAAQGKSIDWNQDATSFARELLLIESAGYLIWTDRSGRNVSRTDPLGNSQYWLQEIWELRLTPSGRDRARGRIIQRPLPEPDEDDERPIAGMTLEEIARAIGDTYTGGQLPRYLHDSGVPDEYIPPEVTGSKWEYVLDVFERLHNGGSAARRTLREFLGAWIDGRHHVAPQPEVRAHVLGTLGNQGWHVLDGRLVIGERVYALASPTSPLSSDRRIADLHVEVRQVADRYLESGHPEVAIFEAFKAVINRVRAMTKLDSDGSELMSKAFSEVDPPISVGDLETETGRNIQAGYRFIFMGAARAIRNPDAHEQFKTLGNEEALEMLAFASLLMRRLDDATNRTITED